MLAGPLSCLAERGENASMRKQSHVVCELDDRIDLHPRVSFEVHRVAPKSDPSALCPHWLYNWPFHSAHPPLQLHLPTLFPSSGLTDSFLPHPAPITPPSLASPLGTLYPSFPYHTPRSRASHPLHLPAGERSCSREEWRPQLSQPSLTFFSRSPTRKRRDPRP